MGVAAHVDRNAVDGGREVRAVVEIEAPQIVLVGLAAAGVGGDDHAGDGFQQLPLPQERTLQQLLAADHPAAGGQVAADGLRATRGDDDALDGGDCVVMAEFRQRRRGGGWKPEQPHRQATENPARSREELHLEFPLSASRPGSEGATASNLT